VRIDQACDRFEQAWNQGEQPRIEDYLAAAPEAERPWLLRELLALELAFRRRQDETLTLEEFCQRFPAYAEWVAEVYACFAWPGWIGFAGDGIGPLLPQHRAGAGTCRSGRAALLPGPLPDHGQAPNTAITRVG
jgi:hypothetical protein